MTKTQIEKKKDFRTKLQEELGYVSVLFMSQGDTRAGDIIMPTGELQEVADRIELYVFQELRQHEEEVREEIEKVIAKIYRETPMTNRQVILKALQTLTKNHD